MNNLILRRKKSIISDVMRSYKVIIDDNFVGWIKAGETKEFYIEPGSHTLRLKIDWTGSKLMNFIVNDDKQTIFECSPNGMFNYNVLRLLVSFFKYDIRIKLDRIS